MARVFVFAVCLAFTGLVVKVFSPHKDAAPKHVAISEPPALAAPEAKQASLSIDAPEGREVPEDKPPTVADTPRELRIAFNNNPPRKYTQGDKAEGIAANILQEFARRYGVNVRFDFCDLEVCMDRLRKGESDAVLEVAKTPEREAFLDYLDPAIMLSAAKCFYQRKDDPLTIASLKDLHGLRVGTLKGYSYFSEFDHANAVKKPVFGSIDAMVKALQENKIDAFIGMEDRTDFILAKSMQQARIKKAEFQIRENILVNFLAMSKTSPFLHDKQHIEDLLGSMYIDGTVARVVQEASMKFRLASAK